MSDLLARHHAAEAARAVVRPDGVMETISAMVTCPDCGASRVINSRPKRSDGATRREDGTWHVRCQSCAAFRDTNRLLRDSEWLRRKYVDEGRSINEIARLTGAGRASVGRWLKKHGIPMRSPEEVAALISQQMGTNSGKQMFQRNRRMVTGIGNDYRLPGAIRHHDAA